MRLVGQIVTIVGILICIFVAFLVVTNPTDLALVAGAVAGSGIVIGGSVLIWSGHK